MTLQIIIVSGGIASGKSELSRQLVKSFGFPLIRTSTLIKERNPKIAPDRKAYQKAGNKLDRDTNFSWIAEDVGNLVRNSEESFPVVIDGIRKKEQIEALQRSFGHRHVRHVHLHADKEIRKNRYIVRNREEDANAEFDVMSRDATEKAVLKLDSTADILINTDRSTPISIFNQVYARLGLVSRTAEQLVDVLVGGQLGSEGKGNIANYLASEYDVLMRVGGPNAGHKVYEEPPYTHISLPCGTRLNDEAEILIGPGAVIDPDTLLKEIRDCELPVERLTIDENVAVISAADIEWEKTHLEKAIGSTAKGVGAAAARRITNRFRNDKVCKLAKDLGEICPDLVPYVGSTFKRLEKAFADKRRVLLEGTQGTGLSLYHGEYPSVTSRDTTVAGCLAEAGIAPRRVRRVILVCRTYPIRVGGDSGNMELPIDWDKVAERSGNDGELLKELEVGSRSGKPRRVSEFDWSMLRKACHLNAPTDIALTFVDHLDAKNSEAVRFDQLTKETINFVEAVEAVSGAPCSLIANRFDFKCVIDRRKW